MYVVAESNLYSKKTSKNIIINTGGTITQNFGMTL